MPRALREEDYISVAESKRLDFIGQVTDKDVRRRLELEFDFYTCGGPPDYAVDPTYWRCRLTGKVMHKKIVAVQRSAYGSRYQRAFLGPDGTLNKYKTLAHRLGITFLYDPRAEFFPVTTKTPNRWVNRDGVVVIASYHNLGYEIITAARRDQLGIKTHDGAVQYGF